MTNNKYLELADYCDKEAEWLANNGYGGELFDVSEAIRELVAELTDKAKTALNAFDGDTTALCDFADYLASRKK